MSPNPFTWDAPQGPDTPFLGAMLVYDSMRIIVLALVVYITVMSIGAMFYDRTRTLGQKARLFGGSFVFFLYVGGTEIDHIGDWAHWRLYAALICAVPMAWGMWSFYKWEKPASLRTDRL